MTPTVSVVLPTRNRAPTLLAAVASVLDGSFRDLELIVVDDASTDDTMGVLAGIADPRLKVCVLDEAVGAAEARNIGLANAVGEFVAFQDSDDEWTPDHLEVLVGALRSQPPVTAVAYGVAETDRAERIRPSAPAICAGDIRTTLTRYNIVTLPASLVRRAAVDTQGGFDPLLPRLQDWDFFLGISRRYHFTFVDQVVLWSGTGPDRITEDRAAYDVALARIVARHNDLFDLVPQVAVAHLMRTTKWHFAQGALLPALQTLVRALRHPIGLSIWAYERLLRRRSPVARV